MHAISIAIALLISLYNWYTKRIARGDAARPFLTGSVDAELIRFRGVDAKKSDFSRSDLDGIAINDARNTVDLGGYRRRNECDGAKDVQQASHRQQMRNLPPVCRFVRQHEEPR